MKIEIDLLPSKFDTCPEYQLKLIEILAEQVLPRLARVKTGGRYPIMQGDRRIGTLEF